MTPGSPPLNSSHRFVVFLALIACVAPLSAPRAGGGVSCASKDGRAEISIGLGRLPIYAPTSASARLGNKRWVGVPQHGENELGESQGLIEADKFSADFVGPDIMKIIISLRINLSGDDKEGSYPGTLTFEDGVAHKVFCEFE